MSKKLIARNPFREASASFKIFNALAKASRGLKPHEVAKAARLSLDKTNTLLRAYRNPFHSSVVQRAGVKFVLKDHLFSLATTKANPKARRPKRGKKKQKKATARHRKATPKPTSEASVKTSLPAVQTAQ